MLIRVFWKTNFVFPFTYQLRKPLHSCLCTSAKQRKPGLSSAWLDNDCPLGYDKTGEASISFLKLSYFPRHEKVFRGERYTSRGKQRTRKHGFSNTHGLCVRRVTRKSLPVHGRWSNISKQMYWPALSTILLRTGLGRGQGAS